MWTRFFDMLSGGRSKEEWTHIYIEAPEEEAKVIFYNRFGHDPYRVTCSCCGEDYSTDESETLQQATGYDRGCYYDGTEYVEQADSDSRSWNPYIPLEEYINTPDVKVIFATDITAEERKGEIPRSGWIWVD